MGITPQDTEICEITNQKVIHIYSNQVLFLVTLVRFVMSLTNAFLEN